MLCATGLVFDGIEGVGSRFHVLHARTSFRRYRGRGSHFHFVRSRTRFRRFQGRRAPLSCFSRPYSFSSVPRVSGPVFMLCATGLVFGGIEGVGSRFHVLRARTSFRRYRGPRVPSSCFALPDSFSALPWALGPVFIFCAPRLVLGGSKGVGSRYHVFRARTLFRRYRGRWVPFSCFTCPD
jgi:hypothetical protein